MPEQQMTVWVSFDGIDYMALRILTDDWPDLRDAFDHGKIFKPTLVRFDKSGGLHKDRGYEAYDMSKAKWIKVI